MRTVPNAMIDRRPAIIARCGGAADVMACVRFAREQEMLVAVRGGGHSVGGKSVCDGGLMIDLSGMKGIRVEPARKTVRAEAGLTLGEFDRETQAFGLATTLGTVSKTGISGLTLRAGWGHLHGKYGLALDNVIGLDVVTADGQLLAANASEKRTCSGVREAAGVTSESSHHWNTSSTKWDAYWVGLYLSNSESQRGLTLLLGVRRDDSRRIGHSGRRADLTGRRPSFRGSGMLLRQHI